MYEIIENPRRMTRSEIKNEYDGKWVFMVNLEGHIYGLFDYATPVVVADKPFEGNEDGIYKVFLDDCETSCADMKLYTEDCFPIMADIKNYDD